MGHSTAWSVCRETMHELLRTKENKASREPIWDIQQLGVCAKSRCVLANNVEQASKICLESVNKKQCLKFTLLFH